ncbi:hypothetical protein B0H16DRAFT_1892454 [Mycena metata]|uniref:Uncharacterized protein n=1 Tax=Mycena metata TaxID=1033252 RepID=A0AAD7I461_9AGAR|nr:hypothetical protein B0H16DRAFT_1892454 [Mycena metata]
MHLRPPPQQKVPQDYDSSQDEVELASLSSVSSAFSNSTDSTPAGPPPSRASSLPSMSRPFPSFKTLILLLVLINIFMMIFCLKAQISTLNTVGRLAEEAGTRGSGTVSNASAKRGMQAAEGELVEMSENMD